MTEPVPDKNQTTTPCLCEFSSQPFDDCYCCNVTGKSAHNIATYCMGRYRECPIYQKKMQQLESGTDVFKKTDQGTR